MVERITSVTGVVQVVTNKDTYVHEFESLDDLKEWVKEFESVGLVGGEWT